MKFCRTKIDASGLAQYTHFDAHPFPEEAGWVNSAPPKDGVLHRWDAAMLAWTEIEPPPKPGLVWGAGGWVDPATSAEKWDQVRTQRNQLLSLSDWTQLPDVPLATKEAWAIYRQALRDITLQQDPFNIVWPVPPGS